MGPFSDPRGRREQPGLPGQAKHPLSARAHPTAAQTRPHLAMALADDRARGEHVTDLGEQLWVAHRTDRAWTPPKRLRDAPSAAVLTRRRTGHASHPAHHGK